MHSKFCLVSQRATKRQMDDRGVLHCEDGPATSWACGTRRHYIHGVLVPESVVLAPQRQTIKEIENESSAEVRRVRIERYGWARYLKETKAKIVHTSRNDVDGTQEAVMEIRDHQRVLVCACPSTAKVFAMRIPHEIETCAAAQTWLRGQVPQRCLGAS